MIDLNSLQIFIKIAECGNLSQAAKSLRVPKSTVSRTLSNLEKDLGTQLVYRTTHKLSLTSTGHEVFASCQEGLSSIETGLAGALSRSNGISGCLRLTAPDDMGTLLLTPIIGEFCDAHPKVSVDLIYSVERLDLAKESIDLALQVGVNSELSYRIRKVGQVKGILVASPEFLQKTGEKISVAELQKLPCLAFGRAGTERDITLHRNAQKQKFAIAPKISSGSMLGLYELALAGHGVALVPDFICRDALEDGRLIQIFKGWHTQAKAVNFVTPPRQQLPSLVSTFVDFALPKLKLHFS